MDTSNSQAGVAKLFSGEILEIISLGLGLICTLALGLTAAGAAAGSVGAAAGGGILSILSGLGTLVLSVLSVIFILIGLAKLKNENAKLNYAFIIAIVSLVLPFLKFIPVLGSIITYATPILSILEFIFVIQGISSILENVNGGQEVIKTGNTAVIFITVAYVLSLVLSVVSSLITPTGVTVAVGGALVVALLSAVCSIVASIVYIVFLSKAKKVL